MEASGTTPAIRWDELDHRIKRAEFVDSDYSSSNSQSWIAVMGGLADGLFKGCHERRRIWGPTPVGVEWRGGGVLRA